MNGRDAVRRVVGTADHRYQPRPEWTFGDSPAHRAAQQRLATLVGLIAVLLPLVLLLAGASTCFRQSISSYYFASTAGDLLVAGLAVIATCLYAFSGETRGESLLTTLAALAALGVALVPTAQPGCPLVAGYDGRFVGMLGEDGLLKLGETAADAFGRYRTLSRLHDLFALILLGFMAYLCLFAFTREVPARHRRADGRLTNVKRRRDAIYRACGAVIVLALLLMVVGAVVRGTDLTNPSWWDRWRLTFWVETLALEAFGVAWVVKGRLFGIGLRDPGEITS
jgi:hypothetical protein